MKNKRQIAASIAAFANRHYGWDGGDALPIRPDVADWSRMVLFSKYETLGIDAILLDAVDLPRVSLCNDGTVELGFKQRDKELSFVIACGGVFTFVKLFPDKQTTVEGVIRVTNPGFDPNEFVQVDDLLRWLAGA